MMTCGAEKEKKRGRYFMNRQSYIKKPEAGVALILAMLVILVLTVLASSIIFVTQSQVWTSFNYRLVTQCRYGAEGGVHQTMNWMQNVYVPPTFVSPATPFPGFDITQDPVKCTDASCAVNGGDVVLAGDNSFNYPDPFGTIKPAYKAALYQRPVDPISNLTYTTSAKLMAMTPLQGAFPGLTTQAIQIWQVTSVGTYTGAVRNAQVQLVVTYQRMLVSAAANALYGTSTACPSLILNGTGSLTDSYNSSLPGPPPQGVLTSGGNVGTNGGMTLSGGAAVDGNFSYSPTDPCLPNPVIGPGLTGSLVALPVQLPYPTPPPPNPLPPVGGQKIDNKGCDSQSGSPAPDLSAAGSGCLSVSATPQVETLAGINPPTGPLLGPALYGDLAFSNSANTIQFTGGTYNINSLSLGSGVTLQITGCPVILNVAGTGVPPSQAVFDTSSGTVANSFAPSCFQIVYGGTGLMKLAGGAATAGVVYAPNASITLSGGGTWDGSIVGNNVTVSGGTSINYDRALGSAFYIAGNYVPMGFNWSSF
jgi:putative adhesin/type IV pilus assembly PilX-like protein